MRMGTGVLLLHSGVLRIKIGVLRIGSGVWVLECGVLRIGIGVLRMETGVCVLGSGVLRMEIGVLRIRSGVLRNEIGVLRIGSGVLVLPGGSAGGVSENGMALDRRCLECGQSFRLAWSVGRGGLALAGWLGRFFEKFHGVSGQKGGGAGGAGRMALALLNPAVVADAGSRRAPGRGGPGRVVARVRPGRPAPDNNIMKLPLEEYLFTLTRTRYLAAAAPSLTGFEPDGRNAAYMVALPDQVTAAFGTLTGHFNTANAASGTLATCFGECHDLAVAVYTSLKASYRKDQGCTRCIRSLPKQDRSPERTLARMKGLAVLWPTLPNVPGTSAPLKVGGTTAAAFGTMTADFETKVVAAGVAEAAYSRELVKFHRSLADGDGFVSSALVQGRSLYKPGTPERALIDRVRRCRTRRRRVRRW